MATIKIEIVAGGNTYSRAKTISGPDLLRFIAAYRAAYGQIPAGPPDPVTGVVPMRDMTDAETALRWADGLFAGSIANVRSHEKAMAAKAAADPIAEVVLT